MFNKVRIVRSETVFRIRNAFKRIRIRGYVPLDTDPDSDLDPTILFSGFPYVNLNFFLLFLGIFVYYLPWVPLHQFSKLLKSHKTVEIKIFLNFYAG
jgi:hypothetical protein